MDISTLLKMTPVQSGTGKTPSAEGSSESAQRFDDALRAKLTAATDASQGTAAASQSALPPLAMLAGLHIPGGVSAAPDSTGTLADGLANTELEATPGEQADLTPVLPQRTDMTTAATSVTNTTASEAALISGTPAAAAVPLTQSHTQGNRQTAGSELVASDKLSTEISALITDTNAQRKNAATQATAMTGTVSVETAVSTSTATAAVNTLDSAAAATASASNPISSTTAPVTPAATQSPATASLASVTGSAAWGEEFSQHLIGMAHRGDKQVDLHLHPRELGSLSVSLSLDDQGARAQFISANATVRSAVEQALPQLREALAQQGLTLGETSVGDQHQPSSDQHSRHAPGAGIAGRTSDTDTVETAAEPTAADGTDRLLRPRGVDLYA
ncbi:flagellar hook-length control protein FliK [Microbulbifer celer]|uniref:Flagellar hook-length control protein FliK n=1 Tax=Microbulbifer celer TaxID=435905 RepID=A0ABW3U3R9_9GAMM|nr:flagellar hook-length control protein FliK [Microbulbifer celer]UFN57836.1 flagellar hook-length control protein FliK [Microbulbifer celer]